MAKMTDPKPAITSMALANKTMKKKIMMGGLIIPFSLAASEFVY